MRGVWLQLDVASDAALVLELNLLVLRLLGGDEPEVDQRLELNVWSWPQRVQEELELLIVALGLDLDDIVEVTFMVCLEGDVHLDCESRSERTLHVVLDLELGGLGTGELESSHSLADVPHGHRDLIVLVGLDI